jgi:HTH-type transcriptional regulator/antitoxin HigA
MAPDEQEADAFARDSLIPAKEWNRFADGNSFHESAIRAFATSLGIHPAIVVGRLQHENLIEKSWHNSLKESIELPAGAPKHSGNRSTTT